MMNHFSQTELEATKQDAFSSEGKTFEQRTAMFLGLMEMVEAMQAHLTPEEKARRRRIAEQLDPRPDPWWRNFRKEALEEYERQTASKSQCDST
jgi:hypothetical protein